MTVSAQEGVVGTWQGASTDVAGIEMALARLWQESGRREAADRLQPPARTSVMNLVVYVPHEQDEASVVATIATLAGRHPSRTIVVIADPVAPTSSLDATVTAQCAASDFGAGRLCWEQITIKAHGATALHAPGIVIPLLLPDLPTYLWWADDVPFGTGLFDRMVATCDRVIVDSGHFARPIDGLVKLAALSQGGASARGVSDFHWIRLTPWRNLMAQFYDREELRPYAQRIDTVHVVYARDGDRGAPTQSLLLMGWLASRLDWTPNPASARLREGRLHLEGQRSGATVAITVEGRAFDGAEPGDVMALSMTATLRDVPAAFNVERLPRDEQVATTTRIGDAEGAAYTVRMAARGPGELLCEELEVFRHDRVYESALATIARMCERVATEEA